MLNLYWIRKILHCLRYHSFYDSSYNTSIINVIQIEITSCFFFKLLPWITIRKKIKLNQITGHPIKPNINRTRHITTFYLYFVFTSFMSSEQTKQLFPTMIRPSSTLSYIFNYEKNSDRRKNFVSINHFV